ncbi:Sfumigata Asp FII [Teratosphaeria destructans]|uniref:Sfumigata Asp FII n=1 Tax=Teratosphaeria destructans TaxID=418781 RepID=A0A9W7SLJ1_9PEZI|nr:Sfumigata Asp FII [Teratosphaeria destructans]
MMFRTHLLAFAAAVLAAPFEPRDTLSLALVLEQQATTPPLWSDGWVHEYPIHASCNSTETALLRQAFGELKLLAQHAKDHIRRFGNSSSYFVKYFGHAATAEPAGWYDKVLNNDKTGVLFRCDDVDGNCAAHPDTWAGHSRGENASDETVICERSFTTRWPLAGLCGYGYTVAGSPNAAYFASDLLHRLFHTEKIGETVVRDYYDSYEDVLAIAKNDSAIAVRNSATLRYFALDVYAYDIAVPGIGCTGVPPPEGTSFD